MGPHWQLQLTRGPLHKGVPYQPRDEARGSLDLSYHQDYF